MAAPAAATGAEVKHNAGVEAPARLFAQVASNAGVAMFARGDCIRIVHPLFQVGGGGSIPTSPLQLHVGKITAPLAVKLNEIWHSRMPKLDNFNFCNPCFGAEYENIFYAVAMWSLPIAANRIKNGTNCLELRRLAIAPDAPKNTASRMLSIMTRMIRKERPDIERLISYQDTEVHKGTIYAAAGWKAVRTGKFQSWDVHSKRPGKIDQSLAPKVRWELNMANAGVHARP